VTRDATLNTENLKISKLKVTGTINTILHLIFIKMFVFVHILLELTYISHTIMPLLQITDLS
jgi:hypothetical protein